MARLFDRTMTIIKAKWNKLLNRAENPQETLDYSYEQQLQLLQNVKRGVADVVTAKKRLELERGRLETASRSSSRRRATRSRTGVKTSPGWPSSGRPRRRRSSRISTAR